MWFWIWLKIWYEKRTLRFARKCRFEYWRRRLSALGEGTQFYGKVVIYNPQIVEVGSNSTFNEGVILIAKKEKIQIGNNVRISAKALITATGLDIYKDEPPYMHVSKEIKIDDGVWIGTGAQIMPGVTLGRQSVVAAGAVVTKDVKPYAIVAGVPARVVGEITN